MPAQPPPLSRNRSWSDVLTNTLPLGVQQTAQLPVDYVSLNSCLGKPGTSPLFRPGLVMDLPGLPGLDQPKPSTTATSAQPANHPKSKNVATPSWPRVPSERRAHPSPPLNSSATSTTEIATGDTQQEKQVSSRLPTKPRTSKPDAISNSDTPPRAKKKILSFKTKSKKSHVPPPRKAVETLQDSPTKAQPPTVTRKWSTVASTAVERTPPPPHSSSRGPRVPTRREQTRLASPSRLVSCWDGDIFEHGLGSDSDPEDDNENIIPFFLVFSKLNFSLGYNANVVRNPDFQGLHWVERSISLKLKTQLRRNNIGANNRKQLVGVLQQAYNRTSLFHSFLCVCVCL